MIFDFEICFLICFFFLCRHNLQPFFAFFCWRRVQSGQPPLHLEYIGGVFCIYKVCVISSFNSLLAEKYKLHSMHWTVINGRRHRPREWHVVICIHQTNNRQRSHRIEDNIRIWMVTARVSQKKRTQFPIYLLRYSNCRFSSIFFLFRFCLFFTTTWQNQYVDLDALPRWIIKRRKKK